MNINELKNEFVMPKVEITLFETDDVITTSGKDGGGFYGTWDDSFPIDG